MEQIPVIAKNLRILRKRKQLTQQQVAEKIYVSRETYTYYETGRSPVPADKLLLIAPLFEINDLATFMTVPLEAA